jgi:ADP-heptose:LPS heptosyltransferase
MSTASIVMAPFANGRMKEWRDSNFQRFIDLGLENGYMFQLVGALTQRPLADDLVRRYPAHQVENLCGAISWAELTSAIEDAAFVVANDSGIGHLAASIGQWVLCIFSAKHSWVEWMPRGPRVVTLVRAPACSPCNAGSCPNSLACMDLLSADFAFSTMRAAMAGELGHAPS